MSCSGTAPLPRACAAMLRATEIPDTKTARRRSTIFVSVVMLPRIRTSPGVTTLCSNHHVPWTRGASRLEVGALEAPASTPCGLQMLTAVEIQEGPGDAAGTFGAQEYRCIGYFRGGNDSAER